MRGLFLSPMHIRLLGWTLPSIALCPSLPLPTRWISSPSHKLNYYRAVRDQPDCQRKHFVTAGGGGSCMSCELSLPSSEFI